MAPGSSFSWPSRTPRIAHYRALRFEELSALTSGPTTLLLRICPNSLIRQFNRLCCRRAHNLPCTNKSAILLARPDGSQKKSYCFGSIDCIPTQYIILIRIPRNMRRYTFYWLTANLFSQSPEPKGVNFLYANTHTQKGGRVSLGRCYLFWLHTAFN